MPEHPAHAVRDITLKFRENAVPDRASESSAAPHERFADRVRWIRSPSHADEAAGERARGGRESRAHLAAVVLGPEVDRHRTPYAPPKTSGRGRIGNQPARVVGPRAFGTHRSRVLVQRESRQIDAGALGHALDVTRAKPPLKPLRTLRPLRWTVHGLRDAAEQSGARDRRGRKQLVAVITRLFKCRKT